MAEFDKQKFIEWVKTYAKYDQLAIDGKAAFEGWNIRDAQSVFSHLKGILAFSEEVVELVERFSKDVAYLSGPQKLDVAVDFLDDLIKLPIWFEWADQVVLRYVISTVVEKYNAAFGHGWLEAKNGTK